MTLRLPQTPSYRSLPGAGAFALVIILLALSPFAVALEVHHALAAADHDDHQHSESDLCQWVQHHAGSSLLAGVPTAVSTFAVEQHESPSITLLVSTRIITVGPPRAPPLS